MQELTLYIPFGSSCTIAYQLEKHKLRKSSYPFDWILSDEKAIYNILNNEFKNFIDQEYLQVKNTSHNFPIIDESWNNDKKNTIRVFHKLYKIHFLHDFRNIDDIDIVREKYNRRIKRFLDCMRNQNLKKIVVHIGNNFDRQKFHELFIKLNFKNYEIKNISYTEIGYTSDWMMNEFNWKQYFNSINCGKF